MTTRLHRPRLGEREGSIELLRIVCMLLIIAHHMVYHSGAMQTPVQGNKVLSRFLFAGGQTGVNCFVLITGYFLAPFRARRFASVVGQTVFYSLGLTLLVKAAGWAQPTDERILDSALVISRSPYWFVTMYLGLNLLLPALQPLVMGMSKRRHQWILAVGTIYLCLLPTVTLQRPASPFFHNLTWFCYLYLLGAYFKKHPFRLARCAPLQAGIFLAMITLMGLSSLWGQEHPALFEKVASKHNFFADKNALPQLICSCALFLLFAGRKIKASRGLCLLSGASFGVYLLHDHALLRSVLWGKWLRIFAASQRDNFWMLALLGPVGIYVLGAALDLTRKYVLERPLLSQLDPLFNRLDNWLAVK